MAPAHAVGAAERVSRHLASDGHSATRSWPCGHALDPSTARPETIGGRTARKPGDRGDHGCAPMAPAIALPGGSHEALDLAARLDTREFELGNLQLLVPAGRLSVFPRYFPCAEGRLTNYWFFLPQCQTAKRDSAPARHGGRSANSGLSRHSRGRPRPAPRPTCVAISTAALRIERQGAPAGNSSHGASPGCA
jgi:hypothetical protein